MTILEGLAKWRPLEREANGEWAFYPLRLLAPVLIPLVLLLWLVMCAVVLVRRALRKGTS